MPVERVARHDGWTITLQRHFIEVLADTGSVSAAAQSVGKSRMSAYTLRRAAGAEAFAAAWDAAIEVAVDQLTDVALEHALHGTEETTTDDDGHTTRRVRHNHRLMMFLLRAHRPGRYGTQPAAAREPVDGGRLGAALDTLLPPPPPEPHLLGGPVAAWEKLLDKGLVPLPSGAGPAADGPAADGPAAAGPPNRSAV